MKKLILLLPYMFVLVSCSESELTQEADNILVATRAGNSCFPALQTVSLSIREGSSSTYIDWFDCTEFTHDHTYTLNISGSFWGTYEVKRPPVSIPYILQEGDQISLSLTTAGINGSETIINEFTKQNNNLIHRKLCEQTFPDIKAFYAFQTIDGTSKGQLYFSLNANSFDGHQAFHVRFFNTIDGFPISEFHDELLYSSSSSINIYLQLNAYNIYTEYGIIKVMIDAYEGCYPNSNTRHYMYGDININPNGVSDSEIKFIEVMKVNDGNTW